MIMNISELTIGMGPLFIRNFMKTGSRLTYLSGETLFEEGEAALHFYTLIEGEVYLVAGGAERSVYTVYRNGELFGWPFLVKGNMYNTSAVCAQPVETIRFERDMLFDLFLSNPCKGVLFYKKLSEMLSKPLPGLDDEEAVSFLKASGPLETKSLCCCH